MTAVGARHGRFPETTFAPAFLAPGDSLVETPATFGSSSPVWAEPAAKGPVPIGAAHRRSCLQMKIGADRYDMWFRPQDPPDPLAGNLLIVEAANAFSVNWIRE